MDKELSMLLRKNAVSVFQIAMMEKLAKSDLFTAGQRLAVITMMEQAEAEQSERYNELRKAVES